MGKFKILISTVDQSRYFRRKREFFKQELAKLPDVEVRTVDKEGDIRDIMKAMKFTPDFIYIDDLIKNKPLHGLDAISIPKGLLYEDLQKHQDTFHQFIKKNKVDIIFAYYRDAFLKFFPEKKDRLIWVPPFINTKLFKDYGLEKKIDYLLLGSLHEDEYPLRTKITKEMANVKGFVRHPPPERKNYTKEEEKKALIMENYAKEINRAKMFFTDGSKNNYPIFKYFEVPACNTLLLAPALPELKEIGFKNEHTFVDINAKNYYEKAKYYLKHEDKRKAIAKNGYELIRARHTTEIRVREFVDQIKRFLKK